MNMSPGRKLAILTNSRRASPSLGESRAQAHRRTSRGRYRADLAPCRAHCAFDIADPVAGLEFGGCGVHGISPDESEICGRAWSQARLAPFDAQTPSMLGHQSSAGQGTGGGCRPARPTERAPSVDW